MARSFNGTSHFASRAVDLSGYTALSVSYWFYWNSYANNDTLAGEYTPNYNSASGFIMNANASSFGGGGFDVGFHGAPGAWVDNYPRPSAAAWHHLLLTYNRATPATTFYIDGVLQATRGTQHPAGAFGNFANSTLYLMSRAGTSLFGAGRMADLTLWGGVILGQTAATGLATGTSPFSVSPSSLLLYAPFYGAASPEPDYSGAQRGVTISGATAINPPNLSRRMIGVG